MDTHMAVIFLTSRPKALLSKFKKAIDDGHVTTWTYDVDGDFTHTPDQWRNKAWLRPRTSDGRLVLNTLPPASRPISRQVYGVYHGRFVESMLVHCDDGFSQGYATALPTGADNTGA